MRRNKYNAKSNVYNGRRYDSKLEASYAMQLDWLIKAGEIKDVIPQKKIQLKVGDIHITNHYVDFEVHYSDGRIEWHEVKGFETQLWLIKKRLVHALYPNMVYKVIHKVSTY